MVMESLGEFFIVSDEEYVSDLSDAEAEARVDWLLKSLGEAQESLFGDRKPYVPTDEEKGKWYDELAEKGELTGPLEGMSREEYIAGIERSDHSFPVLEGLSKAEKGRAFDEWAMNGFRRMGMEAAAEARAAEVEIVGWEPA